MSDNEEDKLVPLVVALLIFVTTGAVAILLLAKWGGQNAICEQVAGEHYKVVEGVCYRLENHKMIKVRPE